MRVGLGGLGGEDWTKGVFDEVEKNITKGLLLTKSHPALRPLHTHLTLLNARFTLATSTPSNKTIKDRVAKGILTRLLTTGVISMKHRYEAWLLLVEGGSYVSMEEKRRIIAGMKEDAQQRNEKGIEVLAEVMLAELGGIEEDISRAERVMESIDDSDSDWAKALKMRLWTVGVLHYTRLGRHQQAADRLAKVHAIVDQNTQMGSMGAILIPIVKGHLSITNTHPVVVNLLTYLVSSTSKRDAMGRTNKRIVFAVEGLRECEKALVGSLEMHIWATFNDLMAVRMTVAGIKADLLSELVGISILRSDTPSAQDYLGQLIAHTRTYGLFTLNDTTPNPYPYAPIISLHHAHLAHLSGDFQRARQCYGAAAYLSRSPRNTEPSGRRKITAEYAQVPGIDLIHSSAVIGRVALDIGEARRNGLPIDDVLERVPIAETLNEALESGGVLESMARIILSCLADEILVAKDHLKAALSGTSSAKDNYLRALVFALTGSYYMQTSADHAKDMLKAAGGIAGGLGAPLKDDGSDLVNPGKTGMIALRMWVAERMLDMSKKRGNGEKVREHEKELRGLQRVIHMRKN